MINIWDKSKFNYRELAIKYHPDHPGGDKFLFQQVSKLDKAIKEGRLHLSKGDLCDVWINYNTDSIDKISFVENKSAKKLLKKELKTLEELHSKFSGNVFSKMIPSINNNSEYINSFIPKKEYYTLKEIINFHKGTLDGRHFIWMFKRLLSILGSIHEYGIVHNAITPEHILYGIYDHGIQLIDWIHSGKMDDNISIIPLKYKNMYGDHKKGSEKLDIEMASKCFSGIINERKLKLFLKGCMYINSGAFYIHDQLDLLAKELYGAPKFVDLNFLPTI